MRLTKARMISFAAAVVLVGGVIWLSLGYLRDANRTTYTVRLQDVGGLRPGAGVFYRGLEVGHVAEISLDPNRKWANAIIKVNRNLDLRKDAWFHLSSHGLLGEALLAIGDLGSSPQRAVERDILESRELASVRNVLEGIDETVGKARTILTRIDTWLNDAPTSNQVKDIHVRLQRMEEKLDRLLSQNTAKQAP